VSTVNRPLAITKELSPNDTGDTGGHQAGILVPKDARILSFFPPVDASHKNPRHELIFFDDAGQRWEFAFIYYNNARFGGTRNEYRLTRMTAYIRGNGLKPGDSIVLRRDAETTRRFVSYQRAKQPTWTQSGALKLGSTWREVKL
jgi:hypothetical protein